MIIERKILASAMLAFSFCVQTFSDIEAAEQKDPIKDLFGIGFNMDASEVRDRLQNSCNSLSVHETGNVALPVAAMEEQQVICLEYKRNDWKLDELAFVFGDGSLKMIEAYGLDTKAAFEQLTGNSFPYAGFLANREALAFAAEKVNRLVFLTGDAAHAHMQLWHSPLLPSNKEQPASFPAMASPPISLQMGESLDAVRAALVSECDFLTERSVSNPILAEISERQVQLDCFGIGYAGFPRKLEAVFADDRLELAWILTGKAEEDRVRKALTAEYGASIKSTQQWDVFAGNTVALRKDKPEVLFLSDQAAPLFRRAFD